MTDEAGRERVMLARGVEVGEEDEAEVDACAESGLYDACVRPCAVTGDATCELDGVLAGVIELGLYRSVVGTQLYGLAGWLLDALVISWEPCRGEVTP